MAIRSEDEIRDLISKSGGKGIIVPDLSNDDYHGGPGLSSSNLKTILKNSVLDFLKEKENPKPPTKALIFGTAFHTMVLEPHLFFNEFTIANDLPKAPSRSKKDGKEIFKEWKDLHKEKWDQEYAERWISLTTGEMVLDEPDLTSDKWTYVPESFSSSNWQDEYLAWEYPDLLNAKTLTLDEYWLLKEMAKVFHEHPTMMALYSNGKAEESFFAIDPKTGLLIKCRTDYRINNTLKIISDVKTCESAVREDFRKNIGKFFYHLSASFYKFVIKLVTGDDYEFIYTPVEKSEPYKIAAYRANDASSESGEKLFRIALNRFKAYQDTIGSNNSNPGLPMGITDIDIPTYGFSFEEAYKYDEE